MPTTHEFLHGSPITDHSALASPMPTLSPPAHAGWHHHGQHVGLADDGARRAHAGRLRRDVGGGSRQRPPHPGQAIFLCRVRPWPRPEMHHRRCRRGRPLARHDRRDHRPAGARRAGGIPRAQGHGLAAVDRANARRHPDGDLRDRQGRRDQCCTFRRGDAGGRRCRPVGKAAGVPQEAERDRESGRASRIAGRELRIIFCQ